MTSSSIVGQATAVYSLVNLVAILAMVGIEYPLLKRSLENRSNILGTAFLIQILTMTLSVPVIIFMLLNIYEDTASLIWMALLILLSWPVLLTARFALLGMSDAKTVLVIDSIATPLKFVSAYILVSFNQGSAGILASIMIFNIFLAIVGIYLSTRVHGFSVFRIRNPCALLREGLVNIPVIISRTLIFTLTVILLASFGVDNAQIGTFYIALMISLFAGALVSSTAYMVIPHSSASGSDLSLVGARIALSLTVPIVSILLASPQFLLSLIGEQYVSGGAVLFILAIGIIPFCIVTIGVSKFNYLGRYRIIISIGAIQLVALLIPFYILTPQYGTIGAAYSIIISYILTSIPLIIWSERILLQYIFKCGIAIAGGWSVSYAISISFHSDTIFDSLLPVIASFAISLLLIGHLTNLRLDEIKSLISLANGRTAANPEKESVK